MCTRQWNVNEIEYFQTHVDNRGSLFPISFDELPFIPQRCFVVNNVPNGTVRGQHAHKKCKQIIFCLKGRIKIVNCKNGKAQIGILLPGQATYIPPMIWSMQIFYDNGNILVMCSEQYDENDYIRDFSIAR